MAEGKIIGRGCLTFAQVAARRLNLKSSLRRSADCVRLFQHSYGLPRRTGTGAISRGAYLKARASAREIHPVIVEVTRLLLEQDHCFPAPIMACRSRNPIHRS